MNKHLTTFEWKPVKPGDKLPRGWVLATNNIRSTNCDNEYTRAWGTWNHMSHVWIVVLFKKKGEIRGKEHPCNHFCYFAKSPIIDVRSISHWAPIPDEVEPIMDHLYFSQTYGFELAEENGKKMCMVFDTKSKNKRVE